MAERMPAQKRKLSEEVLSNLLGEIRSGALQPGDSMPSERTLMQSYGIGRPAVREALQSLERMGLIEIRHGGRAKVREASFGEMVEQMSHTMRHLLVHSPASLEHLKEARATFEREMARTAARKRTSADVERLWIAVEEQEAAVADKVRFLRLDGRFHREVAAISGNPIWPAVCEAMFDWLSQFHIDLVHAPGMEALTLAEHKAIARAIEARDVAGADKAMGDHLARANELYRRAHLTV
ncbi:MAG: transcriptional regulator NanR [Pseudomonadota bacterium]